MTLILTICTCRASRRRRDKRDLRENHIGALAIGNRALLAIPSAHMSLLAGLDVPALLILKNEFQVSGSMC